MTPVGVVSSGPPPPTLDYRRARFPRPRHGTAKQGHQADLRFWIFDFGFRHAVRKPTADEPDVRE